MGKVIENCTVCVRPTLRGMEKCGLADNVLALLVHCHSFAQTLICFRYTNATQRVQRDCVDSHRSRGTLARHWRGLAMGRAQNAGSYVILLGTCVAGILHLNLWWACFGACGLALTMLAVPRTVTASNTRTTGEPAFVFATLLNAAAFACAAF